MKKKHNIPAKKIYADYCENMTLCCRHQYIQLHYIILQQNLSVDKKRQPAYNLTQEK